MKSFFRRIPLPAKLLFIVLIPLAFSVYMFFLFFVEKNSKLDLLSNYIQRIHESADITRLIDHLQKEFETSYQMVLHQDQDKGNLVQERAYTDSLIRELSESPRFKNFQTYSFLYNLDSTRGYIDKNRLSVDQLTRFYTTAIFRLNSLNSVPQAARIYLPEANDDLLSQKLISEMITYLSITNTNIYTILYTKTYVIEILMGTIGTYEVYKSYEKEIRMKSPPGILKEYEKIRQGPEMAATATYLDSVFKKFRIDSSYSAEQWKNKYVPAISQLRSLQQDLLEKGNVAINHFYRKEVNAKTRVLILLLIFLLVFLVFVSYLIYSLNQVLVDLRKDAELIAEGASAKHLNGISNDVIGKLATSIHKIDENNKVLAEAAYSIGKGNFDVSIKSRSKNDLLSNAIIDMKTGLQQITAVEKDIANLAAIVQSSQDAIVGKTLEGIVTSWNPGAVRLFGYTAEEMIGQPITKLILPEHLYEEKIILEKIRKGEMVEHMSAKRKHKSGRMIDVSLTISPVRDTRGKIIGASKIGRDVTDQKKAQKLMEESEQRAWLAIEAADLGTFEWDLVTNEFAGSVRLNEIFGLPHSPVISQADLVNAIHPEDKEAREQAVRESPLTGSLNYEARIIWPDKTIHWIKVFGKVIYSEQHEAMRIYGTVMDITERKEDEIRKNQFLAVASHELKTPLTSVKAYTQLLTSTYENSDDPFLKNALLKVDTQVNKMTKLVIDFLNLSKIESGKFELNREDFELSELVKEIAEEIQILYKGHELVLKQPDSVKINADREKISQVVTNFLCNAVKYSPGEKEVAIFVERKNGNAVVSVIDKGIGIKTEEQEKVFERFYRSRFNDNISFSGFGIGLYISAEIISIHNGSIAVESEFGKGSRFYFTLPALPA